MTSPVRFHAVPIQFGCPDEAVGRWPPRRAHEASVRPREEVDLAETLSESSFDAEADQANASPNFLYDAAVSGLGVGGYDFHPGNTVGFSADLEVQIDPTFAGASDFILQMNRLIL